MTNQKTAQSKPLQIINSQNNYAQNKALQKCAADTIVYLLVERDETFSAAL